MRQEIDYLGKMYSAMRAAQRRGWDAVVIIGGDKLRVIIPKEATREIERRSVAPSPCRVHIRDDIISCGDVVIRRVSSDG